MDSTERIELEKKGWYLGTVLHFNNHDDKRFGFVAGEALGFDVTDTSTRKGYIERRVSGPWKEDIFFHFNNGSPVVAGSKEIVIRLRKSVEREPQKGDLILFRLVNGPKGTKATPWCYLDDYEKAKIVFAAGGGNTRFDDDNFDRKDFGHRVDRFAAAAGVVPPEWRGPALNHMMNKARMSF